MMGRWVRCEKPEASTWRLEWDEESNLFKIVFSPCGVSSFLPGDIENGYCAYCHCFIKPEDNPLKFDFVHSPDNAANIETLWAYVSVDATGEGILGTIVPGIGGVQMVTGSKNEDVHTHFRKMAEEIGRATGKRVRLIRFTRAEVLWEQEPTEGDHGHS